MCVATKFCFCTHLNLGVRIIAVIGIVITLLYLVILLFGGRDVFIVLSFYHINYVYVGIILLVIQFFIHCLLWTAAKKEKRVDLVRSFILRLLTCLLTSLFHFQIPWLVFIMLKSLVLMAMSMKMLDSVIHLEPKSPLCPSLCRNSTSTLEVDQGHFCTDSCFHIVQQNVTVEADFFVACRNASSDILDQYDKCLISDFDTTRSARISSTAYSIGFVGTESRIIRINHLFLPLLAALHLYFWYIVFSYYVELSRTNIAVFL